MAKQLSEAAGEFATKLIRFNAQAPLGMMDLIRQVLALGKVDIEVLARNRQLLRSLRRFLDECIKAAEEHAEAHRAQAQGDRSVPASSPRPSPGQA
jgi:hypothetical protein